ncbi:tudor domain-containing protein 5-like isoform X3 [Oscarella lobularis]|uniref:tudor domain-containing protein 5-like isoform X3 n=1 Tax=Oscarella lobularis TaxID=121494 RepID=UPI003313416F
MAAAKLDLVKRELSAFLVSRPTGLTIRELERDYRQSTGHVVPYMQFGFSSFHSFIDSMPDVVYTTYDSQGREILKAIPTGDSAHVEKLIRAQRNNPGKRKPLSTQKYSRFSYAQFGVAQRKPTQQRQRNFAPTSRPSPPPRFAGAVPMVPIGHVGGSLGALSVEGQLLSLLAQFPKGLECDLLQSHFKSRYGYEIDFGRLGFSSLPAFVKSIPSSVEVRTAFGRGFCLFAKGLSSSSSSSSDSQSRKRTPSSPPPAPAREEKKERSNNNEDVVNEETQQEDQTEAAEGGDNQSEQGADAKENEDEDEDEEENRRMLELEQLQEKIWELLHPYKNGAWANKFFKAYEEKYGAPVPCEEFGFNSAVALLKALDGYFIVDQPFPDREDYLLFAREQEDVDDVATNGSSSGESSLEVSMCEWVPTRPEVRANCVYENVAVSHVSHSLFHFYIQLGDQRENFLLLQERLQIYASRQKPVASIVTRKPCCAKYHQDNKWYRGIVTGIKEDAKAEVFFIDYGNKEIISCNDVVPIDLAYLSLPSFALYCAFSCIKPPPPAEEWSADVVWKISQLVDGMSLKIRVDRVENDKVLIGEMTCDRYDVIDALVRSGVAAYDSDVVSHKRQSSLALSLSSSSSSLAQRRPEPKVASTPATSEASCDGASTVSDRPSSRQSDRLPATSTASNSSSSRSSKLVQRVILRDRDSGRVNSVGVVHLNDRVYISEQHLENLGYTKLTPHNPRIFHEVIDCVVNHEDLTKSLTLFEIPSLLEKLSILMKEVQGQSNCSESTSANAEAQLAKLQAERARLQQCLRDGKVNPTVEKLQDLENRIEQLQLGLTPSFPAAPSPTVVQQQQQLQLLPLSPPPPPPPGVAQPPPPQRSSVHFRLGPPVSTLHFGQRHSLPGVNGHPFAANGGASSSSVQMPQQQQQQ